MLQYFHKLSTSPGARILFGVLLFAFVIFGIGDVLRQRGGDTTVASIEGQDITTDQLMHAFDNVTRGKIDPAMAKKMGLLDNVLNSMIDDTLAKRAAQDSGLVVGKDQILAMIAKFPQLRDEKTGGIDRDKFQQLLRSQNWSEADLIDYLQQETMTRMVQEAQLAPLQPPKVLVDALYGYAREQRRGETLHISNNAMTVPAPTDEQLNGYYHQHDSDYRAPEYRSFSYLVLTADTLAKDINISPDQVKSEYDTHADRYGVPERRDIVQVMAPNEAKARQIADAVKTGKSLADAAKLAGVAAAPQDMGLLAATDLPQPLQAPVFAAANGETLAPVQTGFGWDVATVKRIEPAHQLPFEQVRATVESELKTAQARTALADDAKKIDDQLAGGASLAEAGKPFGIVPVAVIGVDAKGEASTSGPVSAVKDHEDILKSAFQAAKDNAAQIEYGEDGSIFAVEVTDVTPPAVKPFDSVKSDVVKAYTTQAKADAAKARAEDALKRYESGTPFAALARDLNVIALPIGPLTRLSRDKAVDHEVVKSLFALAKVNDAGVAATAEGPVLVRLTDIVPVTSVDEKEAATLKTSLSEQAEKDMAAEYVSALRTVYKVRIHDKVLADLKGGE